MLNTTISPLELIQQIAHGNAILKGGSLTDHGKVLRVEPIVLIDTRAMNATFMPDLMQTLVSIFSGYYLQALAMSSVNIDNVRTLKVLEQLNPNRDGYGAIINTILADPYQIGKESHSEPRVASYKLQLPIPNQPVGLENYGLEDDDADDEKEEKGTLNGVAFSAKDIREMAPLAAGKLIQISVPTASGKVDLPITLRLLPCPTSYKTMANILSANAEDESFETRFKLWRAGQISLISDLIFCTDLIDKHKKTLIDDTDGHYRAVMERNRKNVMAAVTSGRVSIAAASSIYIVASQTVRDFEIRTGLRMSDFKTRERVFESTFAMLLVEVDTSYETVTLYHRGLATPGEYTAHSLRNANKGSGPDIGEILKAYQLGSTPSI